MKKFNKLLAFFLLPVLFLSSCNNGGQSKYNPNNELVTSVTLDLTGQVDMKIEDTIIAIPTVTFKDDVEVEVDTLWKSSKPTVASVNDGLVVALAVGKSTISYIAGHKMAYFDVVVSNGDEPVDPGEFSISISPQNMEIEVNNSFYVRVTVTHPELVDDPSYTLTSDNEAVATVTEEGLVTGVGEGTAYITAESNGEVATCEVVVTAGQEQEYDCTLYFFIDYNNVDEEDETGTKLVKKFDWYTDRPLILSGEVPDNPTTPLDPAFPYFVGWSVHSIIDTKDDLWDMYNDVVGNNPILFIYGIWSDVAGGYSI